MPPSNVQISSSSEQSGDPSKNIDKDGQNFLDNELQDWIEEATPGNDEPSPQGERSTPQPLARQRNEDGRFTSRPAEQPVSIDDFEPKKITEDPLAVERPDKAPEPEPPKRGKDENMARMRQGLSERDKTISSLEARLQEYEPIEERAKVAEEEREIYKQQIEELQEELDKHKGYRTMVDLQTDPEYREQFIEPILQLRNDLYETADAYGVEREIIDQANQIRSVPQLERYLAENFDSTIAVNRVMDHMKQLRGIVLRKAEADSQPRELYVRLQESKKLKEMEDGERAEKEVRRMADVGWEESVDYYRQADASATYFRKEPGNIRQNRMVDSILEDAKSLHASMVEGLRKSGLKTLPYQLSQRLGALPLKAVAFDNLSREITELRKEIRERDKTIEELNAYKRPNGSNAYRGGGAAQVPDAPVDTNDQQFFDNLLDSAQAQVQGTRR